MSFSFGGSKQQQTTKESSQVDPWGPAQPLLRNVIDDLGRMKGEMNLGGTYDAMDELKKRLEAGNPGAESIKTIGGEMINTRDYVPDVQAAYGDLKTRLTDTADGKNLDLGNNQYLQDMLNKVGDDAQNRVNGTFAAAGRDLSGANNIEVGRGVTSAQLPMLLEQYNKEQARTDAAGRDLFGAGTGTATTSSALDEARAKMRAAGADLESKGYQADIDNGQQLLDLETLRSKMPFDAMGWLTQLLYPAAGLGSQSSGESLSKGTKIGGQAGAKLF